MNGAGIEPPLQLEDVLHRLMVIPFGLLHAKRQDILLFANAKLEDGVEFMRFGGRRLALKRLTIVC